MRLQSYRLIMCLKYTSCSSSFSSASLSLKEFKLQAVIADWAGGWATTTTWEFDQIYKLLNNS